MAQAPRKAVNWQQILQDVLEEHMNELAGMAVIERSCEHLKTVRVGFFLRVKSRKRVAVRVAAQEPVKKEPQRREAFQAKLAELLGKNRGLPNWNKSGVAFQICLNTSHITTSFLMA